MNVAFLGSGNVATVLAKLIQNKGHKVVHIASRTASNASFLAKELDATYSNYSELKDVKADIFIISVPDGAIERVITASDLSNKLVVHTAASVSKKILDNCSSTYGVLYPLQTLRKTVTDKIPIPFLIDGNNSSVIQILESFAKTLSEDVQVAGDEERAKLHIAAVTVSNFTNHLYVLAEKFCKQEKLDFNLLLPLISETANRIRFKPPSEIQTGPASRNDQVTIEKHMKLLSDYPQLKEMYVKFTESIMKEAIEQKKTI